MNTRQLIQKTEQIDWSIYNGSKWYKASEVTGVLKSLIRLQHTDDGDLCHLVLSTLGNNHAGTYYPAILSALDIVIEIALDVLNTARSKCALSVLDNWYICFSADVEGYSKHKAEYIDQFVQHSIEQLLPEFEKMISLPGIDSGMLLMTKDLRDNIVEYQSERT